MEDRPGGHISGGSGAAAAAAAGVRPRDKRRAAPTGPSDSVKYKSYSKGEDPLIAAKWSPSQLLQSLSSPARHAPGWRPRPEVLDLTSLGDHTHQVQSSVPVGQPLFQPSPAEVVFSCYEPFETYEAALTLRNNDKVVRRVRVEAPESALFSVRRGRPGARGRRDAAPHSPAGEAAASDDVGRVAPGMEVAYTVTFRPQSRDSAEAVLVVVTERERFAIPLVAAGAAPALDLPDEIIIKEPAPVRTPTRQALLVRNAGGARGAFSLSAGWPFSIEPAHGELAPGESLQAVLTFAPPEPGPWEGELEVAYDNGGRATYTRLRGVGQELDVGLSAAEVRFPATHMGRLSQRSVWVVNGSDRAVGFAFKRRASAADDNNEVAAAAVETAAGGAGTVFDAAADVAGGGDDVMPEASAAANDRPPWTAASDATSGSGSSLLADPAFAAARAARAARRAAEADPALFGSPHFSAFPPSGVVPPRGRAEVVLQFAPDAGGDYSDAAFVEMNGRAERIPLVLCGAGLGPVAVFPYESLDVGDAFINTRHDYEVELMNRGRVDAEFALQPSNSRFGSKFSFEPETGTIRPGEATTIRISLTSDALGPFEEAFRWHLRGGGAPAVLVVRGRVIGPTFKLEAKEVEFGVVAYGFKHTQEMVLANTSAIPLVYAWRLLDDNTAGPSNPGSAPAPGPPPSKDFAVIPDHGTVPPRGEVRLALEYAPTAVRCCSVVAVMDQPGIADAVATVSVTAECAVPVLAVQPPAALLDFGETYLGHPYSSSFDLVNDSRLPAKFEVVPQDPASKSVAAFVAEPAAGSVPPKGRLTVGVTLRASRLGRVQLPLLVRTLGSRGSPLQVVLAARALGPRLEFAPAAAAAAFAAASAALQRSGGSALLRSPSASGEGAARRGPSGRVPSAVVSEAVLKVAEEQEGEEEGAAGGQGGFSLPPNGDGEASLPQLQAASSAVSIGGASESAPSPGPRRRSRGAAFVASAATSTAGRRRASGAPRQQTASGAGAAPVPSPWQAGVSVSFDKVPVLTPTTRELRVRNPTVIAAQMQLFIEGTNSVFEVEPREAELGPGSEMTVRVTANLDDNTPFRDTLHVMVADGADTEVPLDAAGVGSTVVCEPLSAGALDCGPQLCGRPWQREVVVSNMGRRGIGLIWSNTRVDELTKAFAKAAKGTGKKFDLTAVAPDQAPVFSIIPDRVVLGPREAVTTIITGLAVKGAQVAETLICTAQQTGGASSRNARRVFEVLMRADVAAPLLDWSARCLAFSYVYAPGCPPTVTTQTLSMKNVSPVPLSFTLRTAPPFGLDTTALSLSPGEGGSVMASFDPGYRSDLRSHLARQRLAVSYTDNPQTDALELTGEVEFPNLALDTQSLDFGCVLTDSLRRQTVTLTNPGKAHVTYTWAWMPDTAPSGALGAPETSSSALSSLTGGARSGSNMGPATGGAAPSIKYASSTAAPAPATFDITPVRGTLGPGESERAEVTFYGLPGSKATAVAVCCVDGGPEYQLTLSGEASSIRYAVEPQFFDLGLTPYDRPVERELHIANTGKVAFDFSIDLSKLTRPGVVQAAPSAGRVAAGEKAHIKLKVKPGVPDRLMELVLVQVAHFEPAQVQVLVEGTYPCLTLNLPRVRDTLFVACADEARERLDEGLHATTVASVGLAAPRAPSALGAARTAPPGTPGASRAPSVVPSRSAAPAGSVVGGASAKRGAPAGPGSVASGAARSQASGASGAASLKSRASGATAASAGAMIARDRLAQITAGLAPEKRNELEAERARLAQLLLDPAAAASAAAEVAARVAAAQEAAAAAAVTGITATAALTAQPSAVTEVTAATGTEKAGEKVATAAAPVPRRLPQPPKLPQIASSHYILDFGYATKGINKTRKVKITNTSMQQVQVAFDKPALEAFGFSVNPENVAKLAGAPECESTEVTFSLLCAKSSVTPGPTEVTLPFALRAGCAESPAVLLTLKAHVVVPDVVLSETALDFGTVCSAHCKVYTVQLHNPNQVAADWCIKRPAVDSPKLRDWGSFVPEPAEGVLEPGARVNVRVTFTPQASRVQPYTLVLPIKVANNPRPRELACSGRGFTPRIEVSPTVVDCGATLPAKMGRRPAEAGLVITNPTERPVEVVCLDLDGKRRSDDEALKSLDIYDTNGVALLRPLATGEPLWPELVQQAEDARRRQEEAAAAAVGPATAAAPAEPGKPPDGQTVAEPAAVVGASSAIAAPPEPSKERLLVVLYGPPLSGVSTQAQLLGQRYDLPVATLDGLVQEAADMQPSPQPELPVEPEEPAQAPITNAAPETATTTPQQQRPQPSQQQPGFDHALRGLILALQQQPRPQPNAAGKEEIGSRRSTKERAVRPPSTGTAQRPITPSAAATAAAAAVAAPPPGPSAAEVFLQALKQVLAQPRYAQGLVLDGATSSLVSAADASRGLMQALGLTLKLPPPLPPLPLAGGAKAKAPPPARKFSAGAVRPSEPVGPPPVPPPDASKPDEWVGPVRVHTVMLAVSRDEATDRLAAALAAVAPAAPPQAVVADSGPDAATTLVAVSAAPAAAPAVLGELDMRSPEEVAAAVDTPQQQPSASVTEPRPTEQDTALAAFEARWRAFEADAAVLAPVLGSLQAAGGPVLHRTVAAGADPVPAVSLAVISASFSLGRVSTVLPGVPADAYLIPPPYELRVFQRPKPRAARRADPEFTLWTAPEAAPEAAAPEAAKEPAKELAATVAAAGAKKSAGASPRRGKKGEAAEPAEPTVAEEERRGLQQLTRWVLPPQSSVRLVVQFRSDALGRSTEALAFEPACGERHSSVVVMGSCDYPRINTEPKAVFPRTTRARPQTPNVKQQFIIPTAAFEFGPLLAGRPPPTLPPQPQPPAATSTDAATSVAAAAAQPPASTQAAAPTPSREAFGHPDHATPFKITNTGPFPLHADFWVKSEGDAADPTFVPEPAKPGAGKRASVVGAALTSGGARGGKGAPPPPPPPVTLWPRSLELGIGETKELWVMAYPQTEGAVKDTVMCRVRDNPTPYEFPISFIGAKPTVQVTPPDGPPAPIAPPPVPASLARVSDAGGAGGKRTGGRSSGAAGQKDALLAAAELTVHFERQLLGKREAKTLTVANLGVVPFKWRVAGAEALPAEFKVWPASGELAARSSMTVTVELSGAAEKELAELVKLEVLDMEDALGVVRAIPIALRGELYRIAVPVKWPQDGISAVHFGTLRVVDDAARSLVLRNTGRYPVAFRLAVSSQAVAELVSIAPTDGSLAPGKEATVTLHWNKDHNLRHEVTLDANVDTTLSLIEPATGRAEQTIPIPISGRAQFSRYSVTPARGIHFGPVTAGTASAPRTFEVANLGDFPFTLRLFLLGDPPKLPPPLETAPAKGKSGAGAGAKAGTGTGGATTAAAAAARKAAAARGAVDAAATAAADAAANVLRLGPFAFDPAEAVVQPGGRQEVTVVFRAEGAGVCTATAGLDVSERDFGDHPAGLPYEVAGESCIPGIDTENVPSIFEEHMVLALLDPFNPMNNSFGLREKVFNFGTVLARLPEPCAPATGQAGSGAAPASAEGKGTLAGKAKAGKATARGKAAGGNGKGAADGGETTTPGGAVAAAGAAAEVPPAEEPTVRANLKFTNPGKVPCTVALAVKPHGAVGPGQRFPMEVHPSSVEIPPNEARYVALHFTPRAIQAYSATLLAEVEGGTDPKTRAFTCELRGEGSLPTLTLQEPSSFDPAGRPWLKFGRLPRGRNARLMVSVRNNGALPVSARLEAERHEAFAVLEGSQAFAVDPKKATAFTVEFAPPGPGTFTHEIALRVKSNPFEQHRIALTGECVQEDISLEGLPGGATDELRLGDVRLGQQAAATFTLRNTSDGKGFRFKFPDHPHLKFSPAVGHLLPGAAKRVTAAFTSPTALRLDGQELKLQAAQINHKGAPTDWDDVIAAAAASAAGTAAPPAPAVTHGTPHAAGTPGGAAKAGGAGTRGGGRGGAAAGAGPGGEPAHDVVPKTQRDIPLKVFVACDNARYECDAPAAITFRPTMMFATRAFALRLSNTGMARLDYAWRVVGPGGSDDDSGLYTLSPAAGSVAPGAYEEVTLRFSPAEVGDCRRLLVCDVADLDPSCSPLTRPVDGKVLRPWCHFELPESDYLSGGRRNPELPGPSGVVEPLDPATKVLEFESLGLRTCNTKRFFVLNPTSIPYEFTWSPVPRAGGVAGAAPLAPAASPFACATPRGTVDGGRRYEMVFEYTPTDDATAEAFWTFSIPSRGISVPFLLAGRVAEPRVAFDCPSIGFGQVQVGVRGKATLALVNDEAQPFVFALDKASYDATPELLAVSGAPSVLQFTPDTGTVPAHGKINLVATFAPRTDGPFNRNVTCRVRGKPTRLTLNVKGEGYALRSALVLEVGDGAQVELAARGDNTVDFGQVIINDRAVRALHLVNSSAVDFDYGWDLGGRAGLTVRPERGVVPRGQRVMCELAYLPTAPDKLGSHRVTCQVVNGARYQLMLQGTGYRPRLSLSFQSHDFGPVHIWRAGMEPATARLAVRNDDDQPVGFEVLWGDREHLTVDCGAVVLKPGEGKDVMFSFRPMAPLLYRETVPLRVNGLYDINVTIAGEGVPLSVELADPSQRTVAFGAVPRGQTAARQLAITNRGRAAALVSLAPARALLERLGVEALPAAPFMLRPREETRISLVFRPSRRMPPFCEELVVDAASVPLPLATLTGAATAGELALAADSLPFGTVVLGSRTSKRLALANTGDVGARFVWDTRALAPHFSISPSEGFLAPGQDVKLEVAFAPVVVDADIRVERARCKVEGAQDLALTLTGACCATAPQAEALVFKCNVRASVSKTLTLSNPTGAPWQLRPVIQNDFWSGPEFIRVPAGGRADYPLAYRPLSMSRAGPHEGSVFFPIPDGTGLLYRLVGEAESPTPEAVIERSIPAKSRHVEPLCVANWLHRPQRFKVAIERVAADAATRLDGGDAIDVPAGAERSYQLVYYAYTQGLTRARVTFTSESTGEFMFYDLRLTATPPARISTLALECPVRTQTVARVQIANPLPTDVALKAIITGSKQVSLHPDPPVLRASATTELEVRHRPLLVGSSEGTLRLECPELGAYEWGLRLGGAPVAPERGLEFSVPLGGRDVRLFRFIHYAAEKTEYRCSFRGLAAAGGGGGAAAGGSPGASAGGGATRSSRSGSRTDDMAAGAGFDAPPTVVAPPATGPAGVPVEVEVGYEPTALGGPIKDAMVVSSPVGGEYVVPLLGRCTPPKPQGPIMVGEGPTSVPFRNVFAREAEFLAAVDNPAFVLARTSERLAPKKPASFTVAFRAEPPAAAATRPRSGTPAGAQAAAAAAAAAASAGGSGSGEPAPVSRTGRLTISCPKQGAQWVFYLSA